MPNHAGTQHSTCGARVAMSTPQAHSQMRAETRWRALLSIAYLGSYSTYLHSSRLVHRRHFAKFEPNYPAWILGAKLTHVPHARMFLVVCAAAAQPQRTVLIDMSHNNH